MADNTHMLLLMQQAITLITTDQPLGGGDLGLKVADVSNLRAFAARGDLTTRLPAVLVEPVGVIVPEAEDLTVQRYLMNYEIRVLLIDEYAPTDKSLEVKVTAMKFLANVFLTAVDRFTNPEAGAVVLFSQVLEISYDAIEEDALQREIQEDIWAASLNLEIQTSTARV